MDRNYLKDRDPFKMGYNIITLDIYLKDNFDGFKDMVKKDMIKTGLFLGMSLIDCDNLNEDVREKQTGLEGQIKECLGEDPKAILRCEEDFYTSRPKELVPILRKYIKHLKKENSSFFVVGLMSSYFPGALDKPLEIPIGFYSNGEAKVFDNIRYKIADFIRD